MKSLISKLATLIIVIGLIAVATYAAITYPRTVASLTVSLTAGVDRKNVEFDVSSLHERTQIVIDVKSGVVAVWSATISSGNNILWNNQGSGDYLGDWIKLPAGHYVFTFITLGGALEAQVDIKTKGGFW